MPRPRKLSLTTLSRIEAPAAAFAHQVLRHADEWDFMYAPIATIAAVTIKATAIVVLISLLEF